jgi:hypothetical protein
MAYPEGCVGRGGPIAWPPRCPDFIPFWAHMELFICGEKRIELKEMHRLVKFSTLQNK